MFRIKFQGESLETFFIYEVVKYAENEDLGVVGPPGPARSVTVNGPIMENFKRLSLSHFP